ncbi:hypothetical protein OnM2_077078 [Erysiphe neolycopersici]|uniref:Uncharacterized protein n=1 Tax=Erysiphe neolycopersici TaxID=212602 RepID=A0A420HI66_9PEZI|nr:hypothetical protein OnM2_077078 [Erysiphe neolycopersici]
MKGRRLHTGGMVKPVNLTSSRKFAFKFFYQTELSTKHAVSENERYVHNNCTRCDAFFTSSNKLYDQIRLAYYKTSNSKGYQKITSTIHYVKPL